MFSVKSESSDTFDVGKDSQCIRLMNNNPNISDTMNTNTSENRHDKSLSEEMLLTVAYVKNESTSSALDYYNLNSKGNKEVHGQHLMDINVIKTEKTEACSDNTSRDGIDDENVGVHVKEEPQSNNFQEHDIHHVTDIAQYNRVGDRDTTDMGDDCTSSSSQSRNEANKCMHKRIHSGKTHFKCDGEKPYKCDICDYSATQSGDLKKHKRIPSGEKPYKCDVCGFSTTTSGNLKTHKLIHSGEKPYKCDECAFSTSRSGNLKIHKRIHSGEKPYNCDECAYSTTRPGLLKTHKLIHSGEKPYKCDECAYSTTRPGLLKTHKLIHSGEKPYKCNECAYSTTRPGLLKTHKLIHSGEKPYKCVNVPIALHGLDFSRHIN